MPVPKILIYSATAGYRHESIPIAIAALQNLGRQNNISFDATEDKSKFEDEYLSQFDALLFLSNSDEVLDQSGKDAFQRYLDAGGNYIGIHGASACLFTTPFYNRTVGALFDYHPPLTNATIIVEDANHPSTASLPSRWQVQDEIYNFRSDPREMGAQLILSVDETSYVDNGTRNYNQGSPHPIAWYQERLAGTSVTDLPVVGRSWYTSLGHLSATWEDDTFLSHVLGGITWTLASHTTLAFNSSASVGSTDQTITQATTTVTGSVPVPSSPTSNSAGHSRTVTGSRMYSVLSGLLAVSGILVHLL